MLKFLIVVVVIALVVYVCVRALDSRIGGGGALQAFRRPRRPQGPKKPPRPIGPDDDPEFLRELNRRRQKGREPKRDE